MTIDEQIEILKAHKRGERVERIRIGLIAWENITQDHQFDFSHSYYRIVKEPELIPWEASDVPMPICWIRRKQSEEALKNGDGFLRHIVTHISFDCIRAPHDWIIKYQELLDEYEHSTDGKTWKPCGKVKE